MRVTIKPSENPYCRIGRPVFLPDGPGEQAFAAYMTDFYASAVDAAEAWILDNRRNGRRLVLRGDFTVESAEDGIAVTLRLALRENGAVIGRRQATHRWAGGVILAKTMQSDPF